MAWISGALRPEPPSVAPRICLITLWAVASVLDLRGGWKKAEGQPAPSKCVFAQSLSCDPLSLLSFGLQPARLLYPWDFSGRDTGVGCHFPTPGDLPNPRSNSCLLGLLFPHHLAHLLLTDCAASPPSPEGQKMPIRQIQRGWYPALFFFFTFFGHTTRHEGS